ncbi:putative uncharacterized protein DDB_G0289963 [Cotesia glomerata]|uniref:putative uncharacterized protein DDB_G0289963 n=1 Tax=Cotesia glomerata TaxID=32391 RepID=UPI001D0283BE|nr:putative uncharacterized protein DDB_G0289963 [Cotesia glomerata]
MPSPEFTATSETEEDYENKNLNNSDKNLDNTSSSLEDFDRRDRQDNNKNNNSDNTDGSIDSTASSPEASDQRDHRETDSEKKKDKNRKQLTTKKSNLPATLPSPQLPLTPATEDINENNNDGNLDSTASSSEAFDQSDCRETDLEKKEEIETIRAKKLTKNKQNLSAPIDVSKITGTSGKKDEFDNKEMFTTWNLKPSGVIELSETLKPKIPLVANQGRPKKRTRAIKCNDTYTSSP